MRTEYVIGEFVDFKGQNRQFIMAAVSTEIEGGYASHYINDDEYVEENVVKKVMIGLSVRNPNDEWNEELGKTIARGKALSSKTRISTIYASDKGSINTTLVRAYLTQEAEFLTHNPGKYIKRYDRDKARYEMEKALEASAQRLTDTERTAIAGLKKEDKSHLQDFIKVLCSQVLK
jgi:hypothetical protein